MYADDMTFEEWEEEEYRPPLRYEKGETLEIHITREGMNVIGTGIVEEADTSDWELPYYIEWVTLDKVSNLSPSEMSLIKIGRSYWIHFEDIATLSSVNNIAPDLTQFLVES